MCYKNINFRQSALLAFFAIMLASSTALAQNTASSNSTIDLGLGGDEFGMSSDELALFDEPEAPKPNLSIDKKDGGLISPSGNIVPKTGEQPGGIVPKTGAMPGGIDPKTGAIPSSVVAKTGDVPGGIVPKTGAMPGGIVPKTGAMPGGIVPKTGALPGGIVPKTGALPSEGTISPKTGLLPPEPSSGLQIPIPSRARTGSDIIEEIDDEVFSQMSDIEKQTAVLSLELRREKLKSEIEAIKAQRLKAQDEAIAQEEEKRLKRLEWEKEQERKIIEEQIKLRKVDVAYEKLRQEVLLKEYKEQMLREQQKWIDNNATIYERMAQDKKERDEIIANIKDRLARVVKSMEKTNKTAETSIENHKREITELQTQISILKARLEAEKKTNPFADGQSKDGKGGEIIEEEEISRLSDLYVIMEITGQGNGLVAKLMNKDGQTFLAKIGTALQTGQKVDEIDTTHIRVDKNGIKEYLYFSAGGILDKEPSNGAAKALEKAAEDKAKANQKPAATRSLISSRGVPGVSRDMMLR